MKVLLITGGARGIGAATARELAARGWTTVLADIDPEGRRDPARRARRRGLRARGGAVLERHGQLDAVWANLPASRRSARSS